MSSKPLTLILSTLCTQNAYMPFERAAAELSCAGSGGGEEGGRNMVVLVTGAAGFIGAAAAMQLRSLGHGARCPKP